MLQKTLENLRQKQKLRTLVKFGIDLDNLDYFLENFGHITLFNQESEYSWKVYEDLECENCRKMFSDDISKSLEYLDFKYDMAILTDSNSEEDQQSIFNYLFQTRTKIIVAYPNCIVTSSPEYFQARFEASEGVYTIHYLDLVKESIKELYN